MAIGKKHLDQLRHAVGFYADKPGFRNAFHTDKDDAIWNELKELGFAAGGIERLGSCYFWVTEQGEELIGLGEQKRYKEGIDRQHERSIEDICETHDIVFD